MYKKTRSIKYNKSAKTEEISEEYAAPQDGFCPLCSHGKGNLVECIKTAELVKCAEDEWCGLELKRRRGKMDKVTIGCKSLKLCESMMQQDIMERPIVDYPLGKGLDRIIIIFILVQHVTLLKTTSKSTM